MGVDLIGYADRNPVSRSWRERQGWRSPCALRSTRPDPSRANALASLTCRWARVAGWYNYTLESILSTAAGRLNAALTSVSTTPVRMIDGWLSRYIFSKNWAMITGVSGVIRPITLKQLPPAPGSVGPDSPERHEAPVRYRPNATKVRFHVTGAAPVI